MHEVLDAIASALGHACFPMELGGVATVALILFLTARHEQRVQSVLWTDEELDAVHEHMEGVSFQEFAESYLRNTKS